MHKKSRKTVPVVGTVFLLVTGLAFALLTSRICTLFKSASEPVQDPARYEEVLAEYDGGPKAVAHFPPHIPETAAAVELYYTRRFLQGGSCLRLRYRLPLSELEAVTQQYRSIAQHIENGKPFDIPDDFQVFYLENSESPDWNGYAYGVAVSLERQEVIYWAEDVRT